MKTPRDFTKRPPDTCLDCDWSNAILGICTKFNVVPPMHIIAEAEKLCPDFDLKIPF